MAGKRWQQEQLGKRLPEPAPPPQPACFRDGDGLRHDSGIKFGLHRYGRRVGMILLCGACFTVLNPPGQVDPLDVQEVR